MSSEINPVHSTDRPHIVIDSSKSWTPIDFGEIWRHRELLYFLVWRDVKVRYKQTMLGILWVVLQPILMTLIFTVILGRLARVPSDDVPYPLFAYSGLVMWSFFSGAVSVSGNSLVGNAHLVTKVYFPRLIIPLSSLFARLLDLGIAFVIFLGLMVYYRMSFTPGLLLTPLIVALISLLALGFGMWTSALNVKYRDIGIVVPVLIQLWMFVSPIVYPLSFVPAQWRLLYSLNPLVGIVDTFRALLFGYQLNWIALLISISETFLLLVYSVYVFRKREKTFADIV